MEAIKDTIKIEINGSEIDAATGKTILEVVTENNLDEIPTLCHSEELKPYASCFLCVVEIEGRPNLVPACATRIAPGMKVTTRNERIIASRRTALELLLSNHFASCTSPCSAGCPANVDVQGYVALAAMGEYKEALKLIRKANPLISVCGRICVRKCEAVCTRAKVDEPVGINYIKRYLSDLPGAYDDPPERLPSTGKKIAIVGSGPAGLTAAWFLGTLGHESVIYEAMEKPGGMLRYGIPEYRLPKAVLDTEIDYILSAGATLETGVRIGKDISLDELKQRFDAVFIAAGAMGGKDMRVPGEHDTEGVETGVEFLIEKAENPEPVKGTVVVVGGGNTAMDAARTSWRLGADKVIILYRRTKAEMPADDLEIEDCIKESIEIMELAAPVGIVAENGRLKALKCERMKLGELDESGRRRPIRIEGSEFELPCDLAVSAIGQTPLLDGLIETKDGGAEITKWQTFVINTKTMETNIPGIYAGGDAADDGPTVAIDAIRDGQRAAKAIHSYITGEALPHEPFVVRKSLWGGPSAKALSEVPESPRHAMHEIEVEDRRGSFAEVATGYEYEDMMHESGRCLSCGCVVFDTCPLRKYAEEYGVDMERFKGYIRRHKVDNRHPYITYDPNKCILCSRCIRTCERVLPISALGLVNRGFSTEMRPAMNDPLVETNCISCGNCVDACPVGALTLKYPFPGRASIKTDDKATHCGFCSLACPIIVHNIGESHYFITSSGEAGSYLCRYGRFGNELFIKHRRLVKPVEREGNRHKAISFADAYAKAVAGLRDVAEKHGTDSIAVFVSPELTNEEMYLASRIARDALKTNNIGSISVVLRGLGSGSLDDTIGFTASTTDRKSLRNADLIICNNTDTETDHLIVNSEILIAVKENGAKLIVSNSSTDPLEVLADVSLDPLRGRASALWSGVTATLVRNGFIEKGKVKGISGGIELLADLEGSDGMAVAGATGVEFEKIEKAAEMIAGAKRIVFVHSPDRVQDQAPGDLRALGNLCILLRSAGVEADLLLPCVLSNAHGMETAGADPVFLPGRARARKLPGAKSNGELANMLEEGGIRGALIIGEDPMREDKTASYFRNVEFMVAIDWAETETTGFANIALPGTTYLECEGTRVNFEGKLVPFTQAVAPPAGIDGCMVLANLLGELGIETDASAEEIGKTLDEIVRKALGDKVTWYWNTGEERLWNGEGSLARIEPVTRPSAIPPPVTVCGKYKRDIHDIGTDHYRVQAR
ncbi:FAD-dependent oxidoreductase [bacterium]|nr:FAD-dependent oxidoreductase [bacterium]